MYFILFHTDIRRFHDNTYDKINIIFREKEINKFIELSSYDSSLDIRIPYISGREGYNVYEECKILYVDKTKMEISLQYKKYRSSTISDLRIEKINKII